MSSRRRAAQFNQLVNQLFALRNRKEIAAFLRALFSARELEMIPQRWAIIRLVAQRLTYDEVQRQARIGSKKVGNATINRAKRALRQRGFRIALNRTNRKLKA